MTVLPKYNPDSVCVKCGGEDVSTNYCEKDWIRCPTHPKPNRPHIHRHCRCCHYEWLESPLDAKEAPR